jgi:RNA polymerase sigma-70 factor (ECF subfamily)
VVSIARFWPPRSAESKLDVGKLYRQHGRFLWAMLHRLGVPESDLPDVLQEVLVVLDRRLPTYDVNCRIEPWLFGICTRVAANYRRRLQRRRENALEEAEVPDHRNPESINAMRDDRAELDAVLDRIDPPKRAVFLMFEVEGLSCQEIAEELGIPIGTVHSRLHGARKDFAAAVNRHRQSGVSLGVPVRRFAI